MVSSLLSVSYSPRPLSLPPSLSKSHLSHLRLPLRPLPSFVPRAGNNNNNNNNSVDTPDRLLSAACYLYPFLDGVQYGRFVLSQFPLVQLPLKPLIPAIRLFKASPFTPILLFLTLYFAVVRNPSAFSRYVRFNTMQAIALDVLLIFPDLIEHSVAPPDGLGLGLVQSLDSTVFFFLLVSLVFGSTSCLLGRIPRLPFVADAADRQVM